MIVAVEQVVGAHDGGVAADVAAADPALLQQRHVGDAVIARQIVCGRQSVPAAADDDHVIALLRLGVAPGANPAAMAAEGLPHQAEDGILDHLDLPAPALCRHRSEENTSELKTLMRVPYAVLC